MQEEKEVPRFEGKIRRPATEKKGAEPSTNPRPLPTTPRPIPRPK